MPRVQRIFVLFTCMNVIGVVQSATTRQDIVDAISASATSSITLDADMSFTEEVRVGAGKTVTIESATGTPKVLDGGMTTRFFYVENGGSLTLRRITLTNGNGGNGGAIQARNSYGISDARNYLTLEECTFSDNQANTYGGAISADSATVTVSGCTFSNNRAQFGGAISCRGYQLPCNLAVESSTFTDNNAYYYNEDDDKLDSDGVDILYTVKASDINSAVYSVVGDVNAYCWRGADNRDCETMYTAAPTTAAPTTAAPTTAAPIDASSNGDPHLQFSDGGSADFRGSQNGIYNMLTSHGISVNALFREQDFYLTASGIEFVRTGLMQLEKLLVHGTFIFETYTTVRTSSGSLLQLRTEATTNSAANVAVIENNVPLSKLSANEERKFDNIKLSTKDGRVTISTPDWVVLCVVVRAKEAHFLNLSFKHLTPHTPETNAPHGIIGQSYDYDGIAVEGAKDVYPTAAGGEFATTAQAEGAIEGTHTDYLMESAFATAYKYSRFLNKSAAVRDIRNLAGTKKRSVNREHRKLAVLLQHITGKENVVGAE